MEAKNLLNQAEHDNIQFVSLQISDLLGIIKEVVIPVKELPAALADGVWFDGSSIEGFARIQESDLYLKPDPETYALVPWFDGRGKTARLICDIYEPSGEPFAEDPRFILKQMMAQAKTLGYEYYVGPEPEFYLFRQDPEGRKIHLDQSGYFDLSSQGGEQVMREIVTALRHFGIQTEAAHHEVGPGQYEIDFRYGQPLEIADKLLTLKYTVKKIAARHSLEATFMPKPVQGIAGSGMHVHQSLFFAGRQENAFYQAQDAYRLSPLAYHFIAGQMQHIRALCAILCPTVNSYKRLVTGFEAPVYITWASMNRSALIRVPRWFGHKTQAARIELRCPDPTSNPYLAFAVMLAAGLDGLRKELWPPAPVEENVFDFDRGRLNHHRIATLPTSLQEALKEMKKSRLLPDVLPATLLSKYLKIKAREWHEFKTQVTPWERKQYFPLY